MEFSITDNAGRKVAVKAHNWLFAIASGLRALEVDANTLTSITCNYEPDGSIVVEAPGSRRWWVKSLGSQLPFDAGSLPPPPLAAEPPSGDTRVAPPPARRMDGSGPNPRRNSNPPHSPAPLERVVAPTAEPIAFDDEEALATERADAPPTPSSVRPATPPVARTSPGPSKQEEAATSKPPPFRGAPPPSTPPPFRGAPPPSTPPPFRSAPPPSTPPPFRGPPPPSRSPVQAPEAAADTPSPAPQPAQPARTPEPPTRSRPTEEPASLTAPRHAHNDIRVVVSARSKLLEENDSLWDTIEDRTPENIVADMSKPAPVFEMPKSSLIREEPESLAERLFEASMDFIGAERDEACQIALDLVNEFVPCEASSIAIGTLNDRELTYVAATGPVADEIRGRTQAFGKGLVGMCFDLRSTLVVTDVKQSDHHDDAFDQQTGFDTVGTLCVPILDEEGLAYGVIQLLNPTDRPFFDEDEEAVEIIARALAGALAFS